MQYIQKTEITCKALKHAAKHQANSPRNHHYGTKYFSNTDNSPPPQTDEKLQRINVF